MSEKGNDGNGSKNSIPSAEHPDDSTALININESTEVSSSVEPFTTEANAFNQTESSKVRKRRAKWEENAMKTYAEAASALPGGSTELCGNASQVHTANIQQQQPYDQNLQRTGKNPLQADLECLYPLQGPSNQGGLCQGSHPSAPIGHAPQEQQLQGSHLEGSALESKFFQVCQLHYHDCIA